MSASASVHVHMHECACVVLHACLCVWYGPMLWVVDRGQGSGNTLKVAFLQLQCYLPGHGA